MAPSGSSDLEDEKNSSEFCEFRRVHQNPEEEENSSEFFEFRRVHQNPEEEENSSEFFEFRAGHQKPKVSFASLLLVRVFQTLSDLKGKKERQRSSKW